MENEEQKSVEETPELPAVEAQAEKPVDDRPEINYKMELERRRANEERLQRDLEAERAKQTNRYDANDITTWSDTELYALKNSVDPNHARFKAQAEDILVERKIERGIEKRQQLEKRGKAEATLRAQYPDALNPYSDFAQAMETVMSDLDLQKSPAGRLAAARIVAGESSKGSSKATAAGRKAEEARLKDVKQTLSEGDRPDPRPNMTNPKKNEELINIVNDKHSSHEAQSLAMAELLKKKGMSRNDFFKR
jgi:hypothetical protein